ncbi:MAG: VOC family protein [Aquamicrobium sp.]|uniref:glyoxalase superfamily protein n=1 Tax=Mesorhizobium sp. Pch-S TaxID=2082387 RepID=UPI00101039EA|nr:glyoxalase superfamily protein [Mesorhizobium sp. Pch-S]MBR2687734.1 VOC family protein [Aquamicrobium sp.]
MNTINRAKTMAKALRKALAEKQSHLSHSACLELIAQQLGYSSWNALSVAHSEDIGITVSIFVEHGREQDAARFYEEAFDAVRTKVHDGVAIDLQVGEMAISVMGSNPRREAEPWRGGPFFPKDHGAVSMTLRLEVKNARLVTARAIAAGAIVRDALQPTAEGWLAAAIFDPAGHIWQICQRRSLAS